MSAKYISEREGIHSTEGNGLTQLEAMKMQLYSLYLFIYLFVMCHAKTRPSAHFIYLCIS